MGDGANHNTHAVHQAHSDRAAAERQQAGDVAVAVPDDSCSGPGAGAGDHAADDDNNGKDKAKKKCKPCVCSGPCFLQILLKYQIPLMLAVAIVFGYFVPAPGVWISKQGVPLGSVFVAVIFLISGMKLKTEALLRAVKEWRGILFGTLSILVLTPVVSFGILAIPAEQGTALSDLLFGLAIFFIMPTTLSSGVVLTREANGNFALALLLTTVTNLLSIVLIPFVVQLLVLFLDRPTSSGAPSSVATTIAAVTGTINGSAGNASDANSSSVEDLEISIDVVELLTKLLLAILLPLAVGKTLLHIPRISDAVVACTAHTKVEVKLVTTFALAVSPWLKISANVDGFATLGVADIFIVLALGIGVHLVFLAVNFVLTLGGWINMPERKAVVIMASQKTLPIAIAVLDFIPAGAGFNAGIASISCVLAHFVQILIDAVVASRLADVPNGDEDDDEVKGAGDKDGGDVAARGEAKTDEGAEAGGDSGGSGGGGGGGDDGSEAGGTRQASSLEGVELTERPSSQPQDRATSE